MVDAELDNVHKSFNDGQVTAVDHIDLHIEEGELLVLVGPSGCGKSTTLRSIAGLDMIDSGTITFGDHDVTDLPPKSREISMVFQNYALYPSMTVYENMAFGLKMRDADDETIDEQVRWAAGIMEIGDLLDRRPKQLSGGQQQRVALGRAIVRDPSLFLLDEPLSNLDAKLRTVMRTEIQELQQTLGVATVFVTHDQEEAMTMGDRIAVMNAGRIEQIDAPETIYQNPANIFVADFIGSPEINFFEMTVDGNHIENETFGREIPPEIADRLQADLPGDDVVVGIRPEDLDIVEEGDGVLNTDVDVVEPMGNTKVVYFDIGDQRVSSIMSADRTVNEGETVGIGINWPNVHFFSPDGPTVVKWRDAVEGQTEADSGSEEVAADGYARSAEEGV
jgi:multiple sugar transport system ATP-binding protein